DQHNWVGDDAAARNGIGIGDLRLASKKFVDGREARNRHDVGKQRVAIRLGGSHILGTDSACGACLVLEYDRLLENRFKCCVERKRDGVADAARRKRAAHCDWSCRIGVLRGRLTGRQGGGGGSCADNKTAAIHLLPFLAGYR